MLNPASLHRRLLCRATGCLNPGGAGPEGGSVARRAFGVRDDLVIAGRHPELLERYQGQKCWCYSSGSPGSAPCCAVLPAVS